MSITTKKQYYLGKPCEVLHEINENESLIEIPSYLLYWSDQHSWDEYREPDYCESEMTKIIVSNKYLSDKNLKIESYIESKITDSITKQKEEIEKIKKSAYEERNKITSEINDLKNTKKNLIEKYKDFPLIEDAISLVMQDDEYYLEMSTWHPKLLKPSDFKADKEIMKAIVIKRDLNKYSNQSKIIVRINYYSDGSGSNGNIVKPAKNLKEAQEIFTQLIEQTIKERDELTDSFIRIADELLLTNDHVEKYRCESSKKLREKKIEKIKKAEEELLRLKEDLIGFDASKGKN